MIEEMASAGLSAERFAERRMIRKILTPGSASGEDIGLSPRFPSYFYFHLCLKRVETEQPSAAIQIQGSEAPSMGIRL
jgi:hypothetical protein